MKTYKRYLILVLFLIIQGGVVTFSQQKTWLGFNLTTNYDYYTLIKPETGIVFEKQITSHSGFETGIYYRIDQLEIYVDLMGQSYYPNVHERFLSIPLFYKYYSKIVNAGIGISYDYFMGWRQVSGDIKVTSFRPEDYYYLGLTGRISKQFQLGEDLAIEPELKANILMVPSVRPYYGIGITTKFNLQNGEDR